MKISSIKILNVLGSRRIDMALSCPITLFTGPNGTGKSSIQEAVRMALLGEVLRVDNKKDYPLMVTDGAKTGSILVVTDGTFENSVALPKGEIITAKYGYPSEVMASVMNAQRFPTLSSEQRRKFLFDLTGCNASKEKITIMMADRKCDPTRVEAAIPMLRAGFSEACTSAKAKATEAKGSWRTTTGEAYGSTKAVDWKAVAPEVDMNAVNEINADVEELDGQVIEAQREIAVLEGKAIEQQKHAGKIAQAKIDVAKLPNLKAKLTLDEKNLAAEQLYVEKTQARAGTAPRVGLVHDMARFLNVAELATDDDEREAVALVASYVKEFGDIGGESDPQALAQLPTLINARDMLTRAVANDKRDIATAEAAQELLNTLSESEAVSSDAITELKTALRELIAKRDGIKKQQDKLKTDVFAADNADEKTVNAAKYHVDVVEWSKIAEALSPEGIPGELLAQALKPINNHLRESARATGWKQVVINSDMSIRADGRLYALLSESEQWRCDAQIAEAIAQLSDIKILMLDRVDVLDTPNRGELLMWLDEQVASGGLESVLLFGTFKALPTGLPETIEAVWVDNGEIKEPMLKAA